MMQGASMHRVLLAPQTSATSEPLHEYIHAANLFGKTLSSVMIECASMHRCVARGSRLSLLTLETVLVGMRLSPPKSPLCHPLVSTISGRKITRLRNTSPRCRPWVSTISGRSTYAISRSTSARRRPPDYNQIFAYMGQPGQCQFWSTKGSVTMGQPGPSHLWSTKGSAQASGLCHFRSIKGLAHMGPSGLSQFWNTTRLCLLRLMVFTIS